jgi:hypothetical protein
MKLSEYVKYDGLGLAELVKSGEMPAKELATIALADVFSGMGKIQPARSYHLCRRYQSLYLFIEVICAPSRWQAILRGISPPLFWLPIQRHTDGDDP